MGDISIGCFGKLPIYPDFIRYNAVSREVSQLDQWFQEGIHFAKSRLGQEWADAFTKAGSWNFLFHLEGSGHFLLGVYVPGRDYGGRLYPFFLFLRAERSSFPLPVYFAPLCFSTFLDKSLEMAQDGWRDIDIKTFLSHIGEMEVPVLEDCKSIKDAYLNHLQGRSVRELWTDIFGDFGHPGKYLIAKNLTEILQPLRQNPSNKFGLGLKFPLSAQELGEDFDIPFWFDMVFKLLKQEKSNPIFFWNRKPANGRPCMFTFLNQPSPKNFLFLVRPEMDCDYWYDLAPEGTGDIDKLIQSCGRDQIALLDSGDNSLADFLEAIDKR